MNGVKNSGAGCIAVATTGVKLIEPNPTPPPRGKENTSVYPCFERKTIPDILPAQLSWRYYAPGAGSIWTAPDAISHICQSTGPGGTCEGLMWKDNVDLKPSDVLSDISQCSLRSVAG
jgi:hypothetical protein